MQMNKINLGLCMFGLWTIIEYVMNGCSLGINILFNVFSGILIYFICINKLHKKDIPLIFKGVSIVILLNLILLAFQASGYDPIYTVRSEYNITDNIGTFGLKATMGVYFALAIPLLASSSTLCATLMFLPVALSVSSGALFGGLGGFLFCMWHKSRKAFLAFSILLTACILFVVFKFDAPMGMFGTRPPMWAKVVKDGFKKPMQGYGLDSFRFGKLRYYKEADTNVTHLAVKTRVPNSTEEGYAIAESIEQGKKFDWWDNPHNEFIQLFFEFGLIGVLIIGFIFYAIIDRFRRAYRTEHSIALVGFFIVLCISSLVQFPFHLARIAHIIPVMLALFVLETEQPQLLK